MTPPTKWVNFKFSYAFYVIKIDNIIKCGVVGLKQLKNNDNLDSRLKSHRSTYARFELVAVIQFSNSFLVILFENWVKSRLYGNIALERMVPWSNMNLKKEIFKKL